MKFKHGMRRKVNEYEKDILKKWKKHKIFEKSVQQRAKKDAFVFYDGPPFLTGTPHHGHLLISTVKDTVARYQTMLGHRVERRWGWDCHGLPAEVFVESQLGIKNKQEIGTKISISEYVAACRAAMVKTGTDWEDTIERIGRWVEFDKAYKTMDNEYMESVWWAFKKLYESGKIYEGEKILVYCTKDATPISKSEVAMENSYQTDTDPSVFVYFQLEDSDEYLLAWTTTPWTLPANVALAVNSKINYSLIEYQGKKFYLASDAIPQVMTDNKRRTLKFKTLKTVMGKKLLGKKYSPLFENHGPDAHKIIEAEFVTSADGTGVVHQAPAYGEEDYELAKREGLPIVSLVDENGNYTKGRWLGHNIWEANKEIAKTLVAEGRALKIEYIQHDYPHCHRCGTKLMYRVHPSWFMDIQSEKHEMLVATDNTNWVPKSLKEGRFRNIIDSAPDWNLSRDRYWATPIPVWKGVRNDGTEVVKVIGSYREFEELTGKRLADYHLPMVMDVTFRCDGVEMRHIGKVLDCWFESGSMPFAQFHYPFENKVEFESGYPADFITEAIDQTRGWFYSLTAVNVPLFGVSPYKNLICTGFINAADGKKMSKKLKNYTDPMALMDKFSADSFRLLMLSSPLTHGEDFSLDDKDVGDVARKLSMVWNMYDFFTMYAEVDDWQYTPHKHTGSNSPNPIVSYTNPLDLWIINRIHQLVIDISKYMDSYEISSAAKLILPFIDDASNWYVRRSRRRFWKSGRDDVDKNNAYSTLHYVLVNLSVIMAPFTPFLAEELYQNLTGGESVHLLDWPKVNLVNSQILDDMVALRVAINDGLSKRAEYGIKVRQPLSCATLINTLSTNSSKEFTSELIEIAKDELNVKEIRLVDGLAQDGKKQKPGVELNTKLTPQLIREGMAREIVRNVQNNRKKAGLEVDDRIRLVLVTEDKELKRAIEENKKFLIKETLTVELEDNVANNATLIKIDGRLLKLQLEKKS